MKRGRKEKNIEQLWEHSVFGTSEEGEKTQWNKYKNGDLRRRKTEKVTPKES